MKLTQEKEPMISVVMITYNHEAFIGEAIEGILMQLCDYEIELIIADDCSTDNTGNVVKQYIDTHPNGYWIKYSCHEKNKGMIPNFLWALQQAKGKYIALCEGDDYWLDSNKLNNQLEFLTTNPTCSFVCNDIMHINHNGELLQDRWPGIPSELRINCRLLGEEYPVATNTLFVRGDFLRKILTKLVRMENKRILGDYFLISLLLTQGPGYYFPNKVAAYRHHENSNFSSNSIKNKVNRGLLTRKILLEHFIMNMQLGYAMIAFKNYMKVKKRYHE